MYKLIKKLRNKKDWLILLSLWFFVQYFLLFTNGIKTDGEAVRVIGEANKLLNLGHLSAPNFAMYFLEISLIYLKLKIGFGYEIIILIHLILNAFALFYLYNFLLKLYASSTLSLIGCILLLVCYPYQLYNSFLYTESLFFSLSIIYSCYLLNIEQFNTKNAFTVLFFLLLLCITRPTGIFFAGASIVYLFFKLSGKMTALNRAFLFTALSAIALFVLNILMGTGGGIDILLPFKDERIICEVPTLPYEVNIKTSSNSNSLFGLIYYITHNFDQFIRLAWLKTMAFFGLVRSYYSFTHNLFIISFFYPLYIFVVFSIIKFRKAIPISFVYFLTLIIITWLSVVFSCDEWHNRFFLTLTPFLIIPALYLFKKQSH